MSEWSALCGCGIWVAKVAGGDDQERELVGGGIGHAGSSTRQEIIDWIVSLNLPTRSMYATDCASLLSKVIAMLNAVTSR